jgi:O-antigen/teichoic acid export membrane protein
MKLIAGLAIRVIAQLSFIAMILGVAYFSSSEQAGNLTTIISLIIVFGTIGRLGFDQLILRNSPVIAAASENAVEITSTTLAAGFCVTLATSLVGSLAFLLWVELEVLQNLYQVLLVVAASCAYALAQIASTLAQARKHVLLSICFFPVGVYALISLFYFMNFSLHAAVAVGFIIMSALALFWLWRHKDFSMRNIKPALVKQSRYFAANNISALAFNWFTNIILALTLGPQEVLLFTIITRVGSLLSLPMSATTPLVQAGVAEAHASGAKSKVSRYSGRVLLVTLGMQFALIVTIVLASHVTTYLDPLKSSGLVVPLVVYIFAQFVHVLSGPAGSILIMSGYDRFIAILNVSIALLNVILIMLATHYFAVSGAIIVTAFSAILQNLGYNIYLYRHEGYVPIQAALNILRRQDT